MPAGVALDQVTPGPTEIVHQIVRSQVSTAGFIRQHVISDHRIALAHRDHTADLELVTVLAAPANGVSRWGGAEVALGFVQHRAESRPVEGAGHKRSPPPELLGRGRSGGGLSRSKQSRGGRYGVEGCQGLLLGRVGDKREVPIGVVITGFANPGYQAQGRGTRLARGLSVRPRRMTGMIQTLPLALPRALVDTHRIDLTALYSKGWGVRAYDTAAAPNGDVYALYGVHRYTYGVADGEENPEIANFGYRIITRYSADGDVLASAVCCPS